MFNFQLPQETTRAGKPKGKPEFHLETFNTTIDNKALPLSYKFSNEYPGSIPDPQKACDFARCCVSTENEEIIRLPCFHTYHRCCFAQTGSECSHCSKPLNDHLEKLAKAFNNSLRTPTSSTTRPNTETHQDNDDTADDIPSVSNRNPDYYESQEWNNHVDHVFDSLCIEQPLHVHRSQSQPHQNLPTPAPRMTCPSQPSQQNSQTASTHIPTVYTVTTANVSGGKIWFFDHHLSQSTLNGRNGSNACTFITIIVAKAIITNSSTLAFPRQSLSPAWAVIMTNCISKGNDVHYNVTGGRPTKFSVADAVTHLSSIGNITTEDSFDVDFTCQNTAVPQSSLAFYLQRLVAEPQL